MHGRKVGSNFREPRMKGKPAANEPVCQKDVTNTPDTSNDKVCKECRGKYYIPGDTKGTQAAVLEKHHRFSEDCAGRCPYSNVPRRVGHSWQ